MDFLKGVFSFCHSIRTGCHSGRVKGFERCFEFVNRLKLSRRQHDHRPAILQVLRTQNKLYETHLGNAKSLRGTIEPHLGNESPLRELLSLTWGLQSPMRDIICPVYEMDLAEDTRISLHTGKHLSLDKHVRKLWRFYTEERNLELVFFMIITI